LTPGDLPTGPRNAISDVDGVRVGHTTLIEGDGPLIPGRGPIRTGVTVILPHSGNIYRSKVRAAVHTINGYGKACGFEQVRELGVLESPIALTNTLNVPRVADALIDYAIARNPDIGITTSSVNVVVGETSDGYLNDLQGRHVSSAHVLAALDSASADVAEGNVGAGTGTTCFGWKGGIGTASRVLPIELGGFTLGALV
jgi:D-aminopeptidase